MASSEEFSLLSEVGDGSYPKGSVSNVLNFDFTNMRSTLNDTATNPNSEVSLQLTKLISENVPLKKALDKNNLMLEEQLCTISAWRELMVTKAQQQQKLLEAKEEVSSLEKDFCTKLDLLRKEKNQLFEKVNVKIQQLETTSKEQFELLSDKLNSELSANAAKYKERCEILQQQNEEYQCKLEKSQMSDNHNIQELRQEISNLQEIFKIEQRSNQRDKKELIELSNSYKKLQEDYEKVTQLLEGVSRDEKEKSIDFYSRGAGSPELHESENAWKPGRKAENATTDEYIEVQKLFREVRAILNKLTSQKFEALVEQVKNLDINTEEKLQGVIDLIFEKAIDEPNCSMSFANMCKHLISTKVPLDSGPGQVNFRKLLLTKCQKEFEQGPNDELRREERIKAIEVAENDKKKELQLEMDEEEKKMHLRQLGNIRFIGELFKLNMLTHAIMHECIRKLLSQGDEESLECLCMLLKTIGKELDQGKGNKNPHESYPMDQYICQMQKIVDRRLTSSRVRFMLQDVIDLKKKQWLAGMQSVPANAAHDINKVQAGQPGMYGRIPQAPQHHHQPGMTGPAPSPQSNSLVQQPQQLNRHMTIPPSYYARNNVPRTGPTMGRNPMPVVNQAAQQKASHYSHAVQTVQSHTMCNIAAPITILNSPLQAAQMKLDFTVSLNKAVPKPKHELSTEEIRAKLRELLQNKKNEEIFHWIDTQITSSASGDVKFIRALAHEVHKNALTGIGAKCDLDQVTLRKRIPLLNRYIDHNENLELQTLYEMQKLMNELKQPKGVLRQIFDTLYDYNVISEETFKNWQQSKDPDELEGKSVAFLSVRGFFTWLREVESGEDANEDD